VREQTLISTEIFETHVSKQKCTIAGKGKKKNQWQINQYLIDQTVINNQ